MLPTDDIPKKLLTQRRNLFHQITQIEQELLWLETDVESEVQEQGQGESMVQLLDRIDERMKAQIEAIDRAVKLETAQYGRCERCGKAIPQSRLEAVPAAAMCMVCEQAGENQAALRK
jgi:RNA polymerase-binding transcription factor DksA